MELLANPQKLAAYREQAAALTAQMTLEEKVSQTLYNAPAIPRLGIPAYNWWNEALHGIARAGTATVFPQAIAMAAAFDEEVIEKVGEAVSTEARAKYNAQCAAGDRDIYKGLTCWAPNVNIFRDPRWGRGHETYGEDPYLMTPTICARLPAPSILLYTAAPRLCAIPSTPKQRPKTWQKPTCPPSAPACRRQRSKSLWGRTTG